MHGRIHVLVRHDLGMAVLGQELHREPPEDVIGDGLGDGHVLVPREPGRLEPHVAELADQALERHAVLQRNGYGRGEGVHHAGHRAAFLGHPQEDLAGLAVFEEADGQVALVAGDAELVGHGLALVGQPPAYGLDLGRLFILRRLGAQRLGALRAVAVDSQGLEPHRPALHVHVHDVFDRRLVGQVDGFGDGARYEGLRRGHHLHVAHVVD